MALSTVKEITGSTPAPMKVKPTPLPPRSLASVAAVPLVRFTVADTPVYGNWLISRIEAKWPGYTRSWYENKIRGWSFNNQFFFVRTENAIGLARVFHDEMIAEPVVQEIFLFLRKFREHEAEGIKVMKETESWAATMRACRYEFGNVNDIATGILKERMGAVAPVQLLRHLRKREVAA